MESRAMEAPPDINQARGATQQNRDGDDIPLSWFYSPNSNETTTDNTVVAADDKPLQSQKDTSFITGPTEEQAHALLFLKNEGRGAPPNRSPTGMTSAIEYPRNLTKTTEGKLSNVASATIANVQAQSAVQYPRKATQSSSTCLTEEHAQALLSLRSVEQPQKSLPPGRKRKYERFSKEATDYLTKWVDENVDEPYPSEEEKAEIMSATGMNKDQLSNWLLAERNRRRKAAGITTKSRGVSVSRKRNNRNHGKFPKTTIEYLTKWFDDHVDEPYPSEEVKAEMMKVTGMDKDQINNWFGSERKRRKKAAGIETKPRAVNVRRSESTVAQLESWFEENQDNPYPNKEEKLALALVTGMTEQQITDWFARARVRKKKAAGGTTSPVAKFSKAAVDYLKNWIAENDPRRPTKAERSQMAADTRLTEKQIRQYFMNHRARQKRAAKEKAL